MNIHTDMSSLFWYAQKPTDSSTPYSGHEHIQDEESLEIDEEDDTQKISDEI